MIAESCPPATLCISLDRMNFRRLSVVLAFTALVSLLSAADPAVEPIPPEAIVQSEPASAPATNAALDDLQALIEKIKAKIQAGPVTAASLAPELGELDALTAKHAANREAGATFALLRASLYLEVLGEPAKARELYLALKTDYADTKVADAVNPIIAQVDRAIQADAAKAKLIGQPAPELHFSWSSSGNLKTLSALKGKVVVLDFWATWCGPCLRSFPQVRAEVQHFKDSPVQFLGVTSLQGFVANLGPRIDTKNDPAREMALMADFMKAKDMTWEVAFSEEQVFNPDYGIQGIPFVAILAPDGTVRHAGLNPLDPNANIAAKVTAILQEFKLPVPAAAH